MPCSPAARRVTQPDGTELAGSGPSGEEAHFRALERLYASAPINLLFTKPLKAGPIVAEGRWLSGKRRVYVAEARLVDAQGEEVGRGTGTFMRSAVPLASLPGYVLPRETEA